MKGTGDCILLLKVSDGFVGCDVTACVTPLLGYTANHQRWPSEVVRIELTEPQSEFAFISILRDRGFRLHHGEPCVNHAHSISWFRRPVCRYTTSVLFPSRGTFFAGSSGKIVFYLVFDLSDISGTKMLLKKKTPRDAGTSAGCMI